MKYTEIIDKINKVFDSCATEDQLETANIYCRMLLGKYCPSSVWGGTESNPSYTELSELVETLILFKGLEIDFEKFIKQT